MPLIRILQRLATALVRVLQWWAHDISQRKTTAGKLASLGIGLLLPICICSALSAAVQGTGEAVGLLPTRTPTPRPTASPPPTTTPTPLPTSTPIPPTPPPPATPTPPPPPQAQLTRDVNMRAGPGVAYPVIRVLAANTTVDLLSVRNENGERWYEVRSAKAAGWLSGAVLRVTPALADALPVNTQTIAPPPTATPKPSATPKPTAMPKPTTAPRPAPQQNCDPAYPGVCIPPPPPDLDCGEIPYKRFKVLPPDPHRFDRDHDGIGCES